jgi:hypothetical protein
LLTVAEDEAKTPKGKQRQLINSYAITAYEVFPFDIIQNRLMNRLNAKGKTSQRNFKLCQMPYILYKKMCENANGKKSVTYCTVERDNKKIKIPQINYSFQGLSNLPKFGSDGNWVYKSFTYTLDMDENKNITLYYRLYYNYLKLFFNMDTKEVRANFTYNVEIYNQEIGNWEPVASPYSHHW